MRSSRALMAALQFLAAACIGLSVPANVHRIGAIPGFPWPNLAGLLLMAGGLLVRVCSMRALGKSYSVDLAVDRDQALVTRGIYSVIRHPIYLGDLILYVAAGLAVSNYAVILILSASSVPVYLRRIGQEERMMIESYGDAYGEYRKHTRKLIPVPCAGTRHRR